MKIDNMCACMGLSSGYNPYNQMYTSPNNKCEVWTKRPSFKKFRDSIKIKK